jgi:hypothetical protein
LLLLTKAPNNTKAKMRRSWRKNKLDSRVRILRLLVKNFIEEQKCYKNKKDYFIGFDEVFH